MSGVPTMHLDARDENDLAPPSLLRRRELDGQAMLVGAIFAGITHVGLPLTFLIATALLTAIGVLGATQPPAPRHDYEVVEARFVKLGRPPDPRRLPDRQVPRQSTAPPDDLVVSKNQNPTRRERVDAGVQPRDPIPDFLTRVGDRAQAFAELDALNRAEGLENGIEEGTEREEARAGDLYRGQLYVFFKRGWSVDNLVDRDVLATLHCIVEVRISATGTIESFRLAEASGNPVFDQSALAKLQGLQDANASIPQPPPELVEQYFGHTLPVRFNGRDAR